MLAITVKTETGPVRSRPAAAELAGLLRRIGADDDHFVVVERCPEEAHAYVQTWRDGDGPFQVEYRDGAPERHYRAHSDTPVSPDEARRIVAGLWEERLAEQARWPEVTDADRVARAFAALDSQGLTARMDFSCCSSCALGETAAERADGDRGFVFFHYQDTESAAEGHGLSVRYGAYAEDGQASGADRAEVGRTVVAALSEAGLPVDWDGNPDRVIDVAPPDWRKRLPAEA